MFPAKSGRFEERDQRNEQRSSYHGKLKYGFEGENRKYGREPNLF